MEVQQQYCDQVTFIGVPGLADQESMLEFIERTGVESLEHVPDETSGLWERFGVTRQRTYVLLNDDGTFEVTGYGSLEQDVLDLIAK